MVNPVTRGNKTGLITINPIRIRRGNYKYYVKEGEDSRNVLLNVMYTVLKYVVVQYHVVIL